MWQIVKPESFLCLLLQGWYGLMLRSRFVVPCRVVGEALGRCCRAMHDGGRHLVLTLILYLHNITVFADRRCQFSLPAMLTSQVCVLS